MDRELRNDQRARTKAFRWSIARIERKPMLKAFCRVAPSVRFRDLAIVLAGVFLCASVLSSRTCADVQARFFFDPFFKLGPSWKRRAPFEAATSR